PGAHADAEVLVALRQVEERADAPLMIGGEEAEDAPREDANVETEGEVLARVPVDEARGAQGEAFARLEEIWDRPTFHRKAGGERDGRATRPTPRLEDARERTRILAPPGHENTRGDEHVLARPVEVGGFAPRLQPPIGVRELLVLHRSDIGLFARHLREAA